MKKLILTSTALVALAGAAAAEVDVTGAAEMGLFNPNGEGPTEGTQFFTDIDVTFTMSGETDGGLSFGASVDLDEGGDGSDASDNNAEDGGATIFIEGDFGTVTTGDTDGALDWALTDAGNVGNPGSIADDETSHPGYLGSYGDGLGANDGQILRYDYSTGDFGIAVSAEQSAEDDLSYAIGFKYSADLGGTTIDLGIGYQFVEDAVFEDALIGGVLVDAALGDLDIIGVSASASFGGGFSAGVEYSDWSGDLADADHVGIGLGYETGPFSAHVNYGSYGGDLDQDGFGISAAYDLGGGAAIHAGYGDGDGDFQSASLGFAFSF